jgi:hypothetical protein
MEVLQNEVQPGLIPVLGSPRRTENEDLLTWIASAEEEEEASERMCTIRVPMPAPDAEERMQ